MQKEMNNQTILENELPINKLNINPEMRVKVATGDARPELTETGWRTFLVKVHNESGTTAALEAVSPNALSLWQREGRRDPTPSGRTYRNAGAAPDPAQLWMDVSMYDRAPLRETLGGLEDITALGLHALQHRGQDAAGILSYHEGEGPGFHLYKDNGLVESVFNEEIVNRLPGRMAIGHTRYSTVGKSGSTADVQPLVLNYPYGIGMAHNGNLVNYYDLVEKLRSEKHRMPLTTTDLEVLENLLADALLEIEIGRAHI